jgi:hypothetical protein
VGLVEVATGLFVLAESRVGAPERAVDGGEHERLAGQAGWKLAAGAVEQRPDGDLAVRLCRRVRHAEEVVVEEAGDGRGGGRLVSRPHCFATGFARLPEAERGAGRQREEDEGGGEHGGAVTADEEPEPVAEPGRARGHRLASKMAPDVVGEFPGGFVAMGPLLFEGLHHDAVQIRAQAAGQAARVAAAILGHRGQFVGRQAGKPDRGFGWCLLAEQPAKVGVIAGQQGAGVEGRLAGQQFVEQDSERVHIGAGVDIVAAQLGLFRTHVGRGAEQFVGVGEDGGVVRVRLGGLGDAEVDDLGHGSIVLEGDQNVARLDVAVEHAALVGVMNGVAHLEEKLEPFPDGGAALVAVAGDGQAAHEFHDEVGPAQAGGASVENTRNVRMVHQRERLALGLEPRDDPAGVHARLDDLEGHGAPHRRKLFGLVHDAEASLTQWFPQPVAVDLGACRFHVRRARFRRRGWPVQESRIPGVDRQQ